MTKYYGIYRSFKDGSARYVPRTATNSKKLAEEIAEDLRKGRFVRPDGSIGHCPSINCEVRYIYA